MARPQPSTSPEKRLSRLGFRPLLLLVSVLLAVGPAGAAGSAPRAACDAQCLPLWPVGQVPGETGPGQPPHVVQRAAPGQPSDRYVDHIDAPWLEVYRPAHGGNGRALLVIPGGGYQRVVIDKEGSELQPAWVDRAGWTLFVLRYRLPQPGRDPAAALADAQRAMRVIRAGAAAWNIDPAKVAVMGFSAGGHVAARLSTGFAAPAYVHRDAIDAHSARPYAAVLGYPVIDMGAHAHAGSRLRLLGQAPSATAIQAASQQTHVSADTPPTLLLHAADDAVVSVDNSLLYFTALRAAKVPAELHVFASGGHGFGMRAAPTTTTAQWTPLALAWLDTYGDTHD